MKDKVYVLLAGVNGAGKSTLYNIVGKFGPIFPFCDNKALQDMPLINSDNIVREFGDWRDDKDQYAAGKIAVRRIREYFRQGVSFAQETTLAGKSIVRNIETAKANGYKVGIVYVGVESADIAKQRVRHRVARGGHGIPESDIEKRYSLSFENLNRIMEKCDGVLLFDNSTEKGFRAVAEYDGQRLMLIGDYGQLPVWVKNQVEMPIVNQEAKSRSVSEKVHPSDD